MNELKIVPIIEEQMSVRFTGKVNLLSPFNHQYLGHLLFHNGQIIDVSYQQLKGITAFYQLGISEYNLEKHQYIVEPEIVGEELKVIHYPFSVLLKKLEKQLEAYREFASLRPPGSLKFLVNSQSLSLDLELSANEFKVLETLAEWSRVDDIYIHTNLLEHEITASLVRLRKNGVLKVIATNR